jgi:hypothetical protein
MSDIPGTTRAQTLFLRAFHSSPDGPPPDAWPSPAIFRRWLRSSRFRIALRTVRDAMRVRADLHLSAASSAAAHTLQSVLAAAPTDPAALLDRHAQLNALTHLLRLAHLRQRFPSDPPPPPQRHNELEWLARRANPNTPVGDVVRRYDNLRAAYEQATQAQPAQCQTPVKDRRRPHLDSFQC